MIVFFSFLFLLLLVFLKKSYFRSNILMAVVYHDLFVTESSYTGLMYRKILRVLSTKCLVYLKHFLITQLLASWGKKFSQKFPFNKASS